MAAKQLLDKLKTT
jgi:serine/threonine-protein kinase mTOR